MNKSVTISFTKKKFSVNNKAHFLITRKCLADTGMNLVLGGMPYV